MADEIKIDLKKPLDKMTAKELKQLVIDQIPQITGASGMDKDTLVVQIKEVLGIKDDAENKVSPYKDQILRMKAEIRTLREKKTAVTPEDRKTRSRLRKKIHALKKRSRRLAAV